MAGITALSNNPLKRPSKSSGSRLEDFPVIKDDKNFSEGTFVWDNEPVPQAVMDKAVAQAGAAGQQQKPSYAGTFDGQLQEIYDKISSREPFQYNVNADPLYQQYKDNYVQQGKLAMKDTMGQAAALTGGYGSTYGQQVGQQAYDAYLKDMGAVIPELYGMAYDMYRDKGDDLLDQYGLLGDMRDTEYGRYRDALDDWNYQQELARQKEETDYNRRQDQEKTAYSRQQQAYANLVALIKASGYNPTDAELQAAGLTREAASSLQQEYTRSITPQVTGSSGSGGGSGGRGGSGYSSGGGSSGGGYEVTVPDLATVVNSGQFTSDEISDWIDRSDSSKAKKDALKKDYGAMLNSAWRNR